LKNVDIYDNKTLDDFQFSTPNPIGENKVKSKDSYAASVFRQNRNREEDSESDSSSE
jgi:hypothetical protein